ncbi:hypothetical protein [Actinoplanes sp. HUAS TT8]|uniref:hypothetical protein n=1 Tax=Actinoplanes sp. HUAS TT8 TaxID=3447453 RepID=UPI003F528403
MPLGDLVAPTLGVGFVMAGALLVVRLLMARARRNPGARHHLIRYDPGNPDLLVPGALGRMTLNFGQPASFWILAGILLLVLVATDVTLASGWL